MKIAKLFAHNFIKNGDFKLFNKKNNLIFVENKDGYCEQYNYDNEGREIQFCNSEGFMEKTSYDKYGNKESTAI